MTDIALRASGMLLTFDLEDEAPWANALRGGVVPFRSVKLARNAMRYVGSAVHAADWTVTSSPAHGLLYGKLASFGAEKDHAAAVRNLLSPSCAARWRDRLSHLNLLLRESGAESLGCIIYRSGETLLCEIGPAARTMLLGIDDDGSTLTYRPDAGDDMQYAKCSWDGMPPLPDFVRELNRYRKPRETSWMTKEAPERGQSYFVHMNTLDEDSGTALTNLTSSTVQMVSAF